MKDRLDKIKEKYRENWLEILLMIVFVCAALVLNVSQRTEETEEVFGSSVNKPEFLEQEISRKESEEEIADEETEEEMTGEETEQEMAGEETEEEMTGEETEEEMTGEETEEEMTDEETEEKMTGEETEKGSAKEAVNRRYVKETEKYSEDTGEREEDINTEQTSEYELFTLQDTKMIRDLYPIYLPGVSGPVEYQVLSDNSELVEYLVDVRSSVRNFTLLQKMIENRVAEYDGEWSVYVKNLNTGESIIVNDQPMKSASVMKLFIMGTVYKAIEAGELERTDEVMSLMNNMITVSDNEASNQLLYLLGDSSYEDGIAEVDAFISEYGFSDMTVEYNGFNNSATVTDSNNFNQVSAKDCGKLLEDVYRRNWVNRSVSNEIEEMLLDQHTRYKIPAGLPEGVLCGNKTGEMDNTENDAAIIYSGDCDYILVVLSSDWNSKDETISRIASLSSMVYGFLN